MRTVAIFRRELRLYDNPLLADAEQGEFIPVFFLDEVNQQEHGDNLRALFFFALRQFKTALEARGGRLYVVPADQQKRFFEIARPDRVLLCEDVEPYSRQRDLKLMDSLRSLRIAFEVFRDSLLVPLPDTTYPSFTQFFKRHFLPAVSLAAAIPEPANIHTPSLQVPETPIPEVETPAARRWYRTETDVRGLWSEYTKSRLRSYHAVRNLPASQGTSLMSAYIRCGMVSLRQMLRDAWGVNEQFVKELAWRDFYSHLLYHHPATNTEELQSHWRGFPWRHDDALFVRWKEGRTGIPLVDAGMRQLLEEGWMHNRVRMVVASYLTKHLLIDWRWGERWFYGLLVDADLAMNVGNWQWVAGCGADALPYFRIFNPLLQAAKFDADGVYIRRYVPELRNASAEQLRDLSTLHSACPEYPPPLVTPEEGRRQFLSVAQRFFRDHAQENPPLDRE